MRSLKNRGLFECLSSSRIAQFIPNGSFFFSFFSTVQCHFNKNSDKDIQQLQDAQGGQRACSLQPCQPERKLLMTQKKEIKTPDIEIPHWRGCVSWLHIFNRWHDSLPQWQNDMVLKPKVESRWNGVWSQTWHNVGQRCCHGYNNKHVV